VSLLSYAEYCTNADVDVEQVREQIKRLMTLVKEYNDLVEEVLDHGRRVNLHKLAFAAYLEMVSPCGRVDVMPYEVEVRKYHNKYEYTAYEYIWYDAKERCRRVEGNEAKSIKRTWDINCTTILRMLMPLADEMMRREKEVGELIQKLRVAVTALSLQS
jgi:hypothetical protein